MQEPLPGWSIQRSVRSSARGGRTIHSENLQILRVSTDDVAPRERLSYWSSVLSSTLTPVAVDGMDALAAHSELQALPSGPITFAAQWGSAQRCLRGAAEIRHTTEHCFNLLLVTGGSWQVNHGTACRFEPGDLIFHDSRQPLEVVLPSNHSDLNLQLSAQFVRKWIPDPAALTGRRLAEECQWGRVLSSYVAQLSPQFVNRAPLPRSVLIEQVGALLALTADELQGGGGSASRVERSLRDRIQDHILQRCTEAKLQAADIAGSLNISGRTLHRALAACGETFGAMLIQARVDAAVQMLRSPLFERVTAAEIGQRAGFSDASHFSKVLRRHTGQTPAQLRRLAARSTRQAAVQLRP